MHQSLVFPSCQAASLFKTISKEAPVEVLYEKNGTNTFLLVYLKSKARNQQRDDFLLVSLARTDSGWRLRTFTLCCCCIVNTKPTCQKLPGCISQILAVRFTLLSNNKLLYHSWLLCRYFVNGMLITIALLITFLCAFGLNGRVKQGCSNVISFLVFVSLCCYGTFSTSRQTK